MQLTGKATAPDPAIQNTGTLCVAQRVAQRTAYLFRCEFDT